MRITVKYLQEQLEKERVNSNRYYSLWQEAKNELDKNNKFDQALNYNKKDYQEWEIYRLMEIIKILTKDPRLELIEDANRFLTK